MNPIPLRPAPVAGAGAGASAAVVVALALTGLLVGLIGGYFGFEIQMLLALLVIALFAVVGSPKLAVALLLCMLFFSGSTHIPRLLQNLVIVGLPALFVARVALRLVLRRDANVALPKELLGYIAVMVVGALIGYIHLDEISPVVMARLPGQSFGFKEYILGLVLKQMMLVALAVIVASVVLDSRGGEWMIPIVALSAVLFVGAMVAIFLAGGYGVGQLGTHRALFASLGRHSNEVGYALVIAIAMTLFAREGVAGFWRRAAMLALIGVMLAGIVMSASRGAIVGLLVVFAVYAVTYRRVVSVLTAAVVLAVSFAAAPKPVQDRFLLGFDSRYGVQLSAAPGDELTSGRLDIWRQVAPEILDHPMLGNGLRSTMWSRYNRFGSGFKVHHPHNMYLASLLDHGLLGSFFVVLLYAYVWRQSRRLARDERVGASMRQLLRAGPAIILATLALGLTNGHAYPAPEQLYLWVFFGLTIGYAALYPAAAKAGVARPRRAVPPAWGTAAMVPGRGGWRRPV